MKLILSRKGFDSAAGKVPSPIFPDGRMLSLPIPDINSTIHYRDIQYQGISLGPLVEKLTKGRITQGWRAHLDPDIVRSSLCRNKDWRPIFGQTGQAQRHLHNNQVGVGDLFLFFGLFRCVECIDGGWRWVANCRPLHALWGWFQVAEMLPLGNGIPTGYIWAKYHPHFHRGNDSNNLVYLARQYLQLGNGPASKLPGAGAFQHFSPILQLTAAATENTTIWKLPEWFYPGEGRTPLSYHRSLSRWSRKNSHTELKAVSRGQEFVLDCDEYPEAINWAFDIIQKHPSRC
jgi:hypothetical protein